MVQIVFGRADSGSVATILEGDTIVVRVHDGPGARRWAVEDAGLLTLDGTDWVEAEGESPAERRFRFHAGLTGKTSLRLTLRAESARVLDTLLLVIEIFEHPPSSALQLLRKRR
jgi:hypothetical protein